MTRCALVSWGWNGVWTTRLNSEPIVTAAGWKSMHRNPWQPFPGHSSGRLASPEADNVAGRSPAGNVLPKPVCSCAAGSDEEPPNLHWNPELPTEGTTKGITSLGSSEGMVNGSGMLSDPGFLNLSQGDLRRTFMGPGLPEIGYMLTTGLLESPTTRCDAAPPSSGNNGLGCNPVALGTYAGCNSPNGRFLVLLPDHGRPLRSVGLVSCAAFQSICPLPNQPGGWNDGTSASPR
mmetsp:Transcript_43989/g.116297  ORF Transcript_43989/g.116297 Transcript_43989/m.116297 type:complete len:234 (-) Transcript_43989:961-1662(-)